MPGVSFGKGLSDFYLRNLRNLRYEDDNDICFLADGYG